MVSYLNSVVNTSQRYVCVSRPRRFGKTMAADLVCAYYDCEADSRALFERCALGRLSEDGGTGRAGWDRYLGAFHVLRLVMTDFMEDSDSVGDVLSYLTDEVTAELREAFPEVRYGTRINLRTVMNKIAASTGARFVIVIDEWDAVFREYKDDQSGQKKYLDFLRDWLKDKDYIALAYMTGILPIKKYGKHSALNMFWEYSMTEPQQLAPFMGFTAEEVSEKCREAGLNYESFQAWYDGYRLSNRVSEEMLADHELPDQKIYREYEVYSPYSVVKAMLSKQFANYWNQTETYEALRQYIDWDFDGLKETVAVLMDGGKIAIDITGYQNDMTTFHSKDDILTMLIHLGYLGYDRETKEIFIPNQEVLQVFRASTKAGDWAATFRALANSEKLLKATWAGDEKTVAELLEQAHDRAGNRTYHSEAALSYAVQLAYYRAQDYYTVVPEMDTGKGYADLVYLPKRPDVPAMLIELKYDETADTALKQIRNRRYPERLEHYRGNIILVGINYDRELQNDQPLFKHHSCRIERV